MNIKSVSESRDERHFIGYPPSNRILKKIKSFFGRIPMAVFKNGEYERNLYKVEPVGWRSRIRTKSFVFPYILGNKIVWKITVTPFASNPLPLREFDIYEYVPPFPPKYITTHRDPSNSSLEFVFDKERDLSDTGVAEYWLGDRSGDNSHLLIRTDVIPNDKIFYGILNFSVIVGSAIFGGIAGAIVAFCLK
jgi:hypothetical protein